MKVDRLHCTNRRTRPSSLGWVHHWRVVSMAGLEMTSGGGVAGGGGGVDIREQLSVFQQHQSKLAFTDVALHDVQASLGAMATANVRGSLARRGLVTKQSVLKAVAAYRQRCKHWNPTTASCLGGEHRRGCHVLRHALLCFLSSCNLVCRHDRTWCILFVACTCGFASSHCRWCAWCVMVWCCAPKSC